MDSTTPQTGFTAGADKHRQFIGDILADDNSESDPEEDLEFHQKPKVSEV